MRSLPTVTGSAALASAQPVLADEPEDMAAPNGLDQACAARWIEGDADGVMVLFTEDATLVPHHGDALIINQKPR